MTLSRRDQRAGRDQPQSTKQRYHLFPTACGRKGFDVSPPYLRSYSASNLLISDTGFVVVLLPWAISLQLTIKTCQVRNYRAGEQTAYRAVCLCCGITGNWKGSLHSFVL